MACRKFRQREFMKRYIPILPDATTLLGGCSTLRSSAPTGREALRTLAKDRQPECRFFGPPRISASATCGIPRIA